MIKEYNQHVINRAKLGITPKPLNTKQITHLIELLKDPTTKDKKYLLNLFIHQVPPGVDEAALIKVNFLESISTEKIICPIISKTQSIKLLGTMQGGYNVPVLINTLNSPELAPIAANALKHILLIFNNFEKIQKKAESGNKYASTILHSWANAEWFFSLPKLSKKITVTVFKVPGETNTDDLSPAVDAWSRPDIPLHALTMLKHPREGIIPNQPGIIGPITQIEKLKKKGFPIAYVGDIVGTGSSRKSAANSILWFIGQDIPHIPNKRTGGIILGGKIAPIFFNTIEDAGGLPIELDVSLLNTGDIIDIYPFIGKIYNHHNEKFLTTFKLKSSMLIDSMRAGGRILLIIGKQLSLQAHNALKLKNSPIFCPPTYNFKSIINNKGFTLAQKIVGHACNVQGIYPGQYCEPKITTVGSQDTTGPMTRDELKNLACLNFSADLVMQSFCHTAAYPKLIDVTLHHTLPDFITDRGGISLKPGDGIIHSWLNRMLLPDTVGTGGDSHTRFPIGISFPAGSGLVAFSAVTGIMPLNMPESVLVKFIGNIQPGITIRDLVNSIPYYAIQKGLLNLKQTSKINIFSGRILEIQGLPKLTVEQAFELSDSSAERSASGCTIQLSQKTITDYLTANVKLLKWMISTGYQSQHTLQRRIQHMIYWLNNPSLFVADQKAEYIETIEINLSKIKEPMICVPNDPDDVHLLSEINPNIHKIDDVFVGSCMTNIGHFRAVGSILNSYCDNNNNKLSSRLWIAPPTKMDASQLMKEGYYNIFSKYKARIEIPGCSLCMGNQARITDNMVVFSTSTRNFPNRLGNNTAVYLGSAEIAALTAILGRLPTTQEYFYAITNLFKKQSIQKIYRCLNFDKLY